MHKLKGKNFHIKNQNIKISILISAYNEEKVIEDRIKNIDELEFDKSNLEVIIGSDNSSDRTNELLLKMEGLYPYVKVYIFTDRMGKAGVINNLISKANSEIIVFTDANTVFAKDSVSKIVSAFKDENVGGVSGKLVLLNYDKDNIEGNEEKKYWDYEVKIKEAEGAFGVLIGANGGIFAIRKSLFERIPIKKPVTDDLFISLAVINKGYKFLYLDNALAYEYVGKNIEQELNRKMRFSATNFQTFFSFPGLIFNKNILVSYAYISHKVIRWFLPIFYLFILILNFILFDYNLFTKTIMILQIMFWFLAFMGFLSNKAKIRILFFSLPYYFVLSNVAVLLGFIRFVRGRHSVIWQSTER